VNSFKSFAAVIMLLLAVPYAHAIPVLWTLENVTFDDGTVARGAFTFDASNNSFSNLLISTLGAAEVIYTTDELSGSFFGTGPSGIELIDDFVPDQNIGKSILNLEFAGSLIDAGGLLDLVTAFPSFQGRCIEPDCSFGFVDRQVIRGSVRGTPIQEPAVAALLMIGLSVLVCVRRLTARSRARL
jgi:hypothetical protein